MLNILLVLNTLPYMFIIIYSFIVGWCSRGKMIFICSTFLALWIIGMAWFFITFSFMWWAKLTEIELLFVGVYSLLIMPVSTLLLSRPVGRKKHPQCGVAALLSPKRVANS